MEFTVINGDFAEQAGQIFADEYQRRRTSECTLSPDLGDPGLNNADQVSRQIFERASKGASVVAHQDGVLWGYMVGNFIEFLHASRACYVPEWGLGVNTDNPQRLIGQMYAWLARSGQLDGSTLHALTIFSADVTVFSVFSSLGFGACHMDAVKSSNPGEMQATDSPATASIRATTRAHLGQLGKLTEQLSAHITQPPVYWPSHDPGFTEARLSAPGSYTSVAEVDGRLVGFIGCQLGAQEPISLRNESVPQINGAFVEPAYREGTLATVLLNDIIAWARSKSADRVTTDFQTANVEGAGFWLSSGFRPVLTTLVRRING